MIYQHQRALKYYSQATACGVEHKEGVGEEQTDAIAHSLKIYL